ncbi:T9SS type A sorting domain-containing protein [Crocinitomicaceae bacterium]|nr:T9SS type A sorting domain-containing protein [Crocinitomicaceae bacterium]
MKKIYVSLSFVMLSLFCFSQTSGLFFSEYAEGSASNKYLEIYNGTGATVDLSEYAFPNVSNAPTVPGEYEYWNNFPIGATIADGDVYIIAHPSSDPLILAEADHTFSFLSNGDDGFCLVKQDGSWVDTNNDQIMQDSEISGFIYVDWVGTWDADPGTAWDVAGVTNGTQNHTLLRKETICAGNSTPLGSFGTSTADSEWEVLDINTWTNLGAHVANCGGGTLPIINSDPNSLSGFVQFVGSPSNEQTTEISGSNLTADVTATVSGDYEISLSTSVGFGPSVVLTQTAGELAATMVYVRLNGSVAISLASGEIVLSSAGADNDTVALTGEILNPDPVLFSQPDTITGFSHFVGTPSAEEVFNVAGNYLTEDMTINVTGEFEISTQSNGTFTNSLTIPANANTTVFNANANWNGYMNVFELPENGGNYVFGQPWGVPELSAIFTPSVNNVKLLPNTNTYAENPTDAFWVNQTTGAGNKNMEAITFIEPGAGANDNDLAFAGNVVGNTLDAAYTAKYFIKALDPNNGYADVFNGSKTFVLPASGTFSVSATAAELPAGLIVQYGFVMVGPNADPATAGALGSVVIDGDFPVGEVQSTPIYVRLNGSAINNNQTGVVTVSSESEAVAHVVNAGSFYYSPSALTITAGDTVYWVNDGGTHNVNFATNTVTGDPYNNPESFVSSPTGDIELYSHVFNTAGTYQYDCSVGSHAANGMTGTIIVLENTSPDPGIIALFGETLGYSPYTIGEVTTNAADGVADSTDVLVSLEGTVHCIDFDGNEGISFTIIDDNNDGINVFNFNDVSDYVVNEGDKIIVLGKIGQFNGLTQVVADSILTLESGLPTVTPTIVTTLDESTESQWITIENVNFVNPITTFPSGSNNIDVTDGVNVFAIRIDSDTDIPESAAPQGSFSVTGVGGQYDNSSPYDEGYQLFPCGIGSFVPESTTGIDENDIIASVSVYPNPFNNSLTVSIEMEGDCELTVMDCHGRELVNTSINEKLTLSTDDWSYGVYMVKVTNLDGITKITKIIK